MYWKDSTTTGNLIAKWTISDCKWFLVQLAIVGESLYEGGGASKGGTDWKLFESVKTLAQAGDVAGT